MIAKEPCTLAQLDTPALLLDAARMQRNIKRMQARCRDLGVALRPHMKTTKCEQIATRVTGGQGGITVSTLREAEYFAGQGYRDIFYAVAIAPQKLPRAAALIQSGVSLLLALDDAATAAMVSQAGRRLGVLFDILVEIDSGEHRSGVAPASQALLDVAGALQSHQGQGARLVGVFTHGGHSYQGRSVQQHAEVAEQERHAVVLAAQRLRDAGLDCPVVSLGSTPTLVHARTLQGVTEARAGVYVLGDLFQAAIGGCGLEDIAVTVLTTVIGNHPERQQLLVDAGGLALSKDASTRALGAPGDCGYGLVLDEAGDMIAGLHVQTVYQEHGVLKGAAIDFAQFPVGRRLRILPNHACMTSAAYDQYHVLDGNGQVEAAWPRINGW